VCRGPRPVNVAFALLIFIVVSFLSLFTHIILLPLDVGMFGSLKSFHYTECAAYDNQTNNDKKDKRECTKKVINTKP
jgi:hypothetical protein